MSTQHSFKLIEGGFEPENAAKILFALINSKINYHVMEAFSLKDGKNYNAANSEKRIAQLREANNQIKKIMEFANENNLEVRIKSDIEISLINPNEK